MERVGPRALRRSASGAFHALTCLLMLVLRSANAGRRVIGRPAIA
jgi:hypothetical protein